MGENSWTREENEVFKNALVALNPLLPSRFDHIADHLGKPVAVVKVHYKELVDDLLEMESKRVALADEFMSGNLNQAKQSKWTKETHEWFMIGLQRFGQDWDKIATLLGCINPREVAAYAENYFLWQKSGKERPRAIDRTLEETEVEVHILRPRAFHTALERTEVTVMQRPRARARSTARARVNDVPRMGRQESHAQPQQEPIVHPGHHAEASNSNPYNYYI